jgi:hypothetical protein
VLVDLSMPRDNDPLVSDRPDLVVGSLSNELQVRAAGPGDRSKLLHEVSLLHNSKARELA